MNQRQSTRLAAARAFEAVLEGSSVDAEESSFRSRADSREARFFRQLVSGSVRWLRRIDYAIERASSRPLERIDPTVLAVLRVATYQLLFLDRVPDRAVVHSAVNDARKVGGRGVTGFVNGVLRAIQRQRDQSEGFVAVGDAKDVAANLALENLALEHSHPDFLVRRWLGHWGESRVRALLEANNRPKQGLSVLASKATVGDDLERRATRVEKSTIAPDGMRIEGVSAEDVAALGVYIQDEASQAAALVPMPQSGERILDVAAAPGGKTLALLSAEPGASVVAADVSLRRVRRMQANFATARRESVPVLVADCRSAPVAGGWDRVVFDAPCSGTGTLRKHPELKWRVTPQEVERLAAFQLQGLRALAPLVRSGGLLCYITCSIEAEENEEVVAEFLAEAESWKLVDLRHLRGGDLPEPLDRFVVGPGAWQIFPEAEHDGATVHVLRAP